MRGRTTVECFSLFLGSTIGNFSISETEKFLKRVRASLRPGDGFLLARIW
jgi:uncharacterized SAM-dependent methyltransferase